MKSRLLIIIGITVILVSGFIYLSYMQYVNYETGYYNSDELDEPTFTGTALFINNNNPELVKQILDYCNSTGVKLSFGLSSTNDTHIITNNTCEWQTIEKYESDRELNFILSICEHTIRSIEDEPASWSNTTHYIDGNNCEWIKIK